MDIELILRISHMFFFFFFFFFFFVFAFRCTSEFRAVRVFVNNPTKCESNPIISYSLPLCEINVPTPSLFVAFLIFLKPDMIHVVETIP